MWKVLFATALLVFCTAQDEFISDGTWTLFSVHKCEDSEQYPFQFDVSKRKINRTHDGFNITFDLPEDFTVYGFGINLEIYKKCEGGFKFSENLGDSSACKMINTFAQSNFETIMTMAGHDPPNCPLPKGKLEIRDYIIDYNTLPKRAKCGEFKTIIYFLQGQEKVGCFTVHCAFMAEDKEDDDDE